MKVHLLLQPYFGNQEELQKGLAGQKEEKFQEFLARSRDQAQLAESLGYYGICFTEQHLNIEGVEVTPNPLLYDMWIAQHAQRLKVGQLGIPLPGHNPLLVAEDLAIVDHMTKGRLYCGFARGNNRRWMDTFAQHLGLSATSSDKSERDRMNRAAFYEAWEIIKLAWTQDTFSFKGEFWRIPPEGVPWEYDITTRWGRGTEHGQLREVGIAPRPLQKPYPDIYAPFSFSMTTCRFWAREGARIVTFVPDDDFVGITVDVYLEESKRAGYSLVKGQNIALGAHLCLAETEAKAQKIKEKFLWLYEQGYQAPPYGVPVGRLFIGTPRKVRGEVERLMEKHQVDEFFLWHHTGYFPHEVEMEMTELFGAKVIGPLSS